MLSKYPNMNDVSWQIDINMTSSVQSGHQLTETPVAALVFPWIVLTFRERYLPNQVCRRLVWTGTAAALLHLLSRWCLSGFDTGGNYTTRCNPHLLSDKSIDCYYMLFFWQLQNAFCKRHSGAMGLVIHSTEILSSSTIHPCSPGVGAQMWRLTALRCIAAW